MFPTVTTIATCAAFWGRRYMATVELEQTSMDLPARGSWWLAIMGAALRRGPYPTAMEYFMRTMVAAICYALACCWSPPSWRSRAHLSLFPGETFIVPTWSAWRWVLAGWVR